MKKNKNFSFKWKIIENYIAAGTGLIFLWLFVEGMINEDMVKIYASLIILLVAPFLVTFVDKKSSAN